MIRFLRRRKSMTCEQIMEVLQRYLDGEVDESVARKVAAHLDECERCIPEADIYREIKASLAAKSLVVEPSILADLTAFGNRIADGDFDN